MQPASTLPYVIRQKGRRWIIAAGAHDILDCDDEATARKTAADATALLISDSTTTKSATPSMIRRAYHPMGMGRLRLV